MAKSLDGMSNEELWELFPIIISEYNPQWKENYLTEKKVIENAVGLNNIVRISHYGSTSVPNLAAKPTVDILLEIKNSTNTDLLVNCMIKAGYIYSPQPKNAPPHMMFLKGYTSEGFKGQVYHVHVRYDGDHDELFFRDYLCTHPETAKEYVKLKLELKEKFEHNRDAYTDAKTDFIKKYTKLAKEEALKKV
ncbi:MAG: GrpB family protein [Fibrobacter sp.]|nr:GrpB family protein [Fibrobacter sp.]